MHVIGHDKRDSRVPFAVSPPEFDGVENGWSDAIAGKRPAPSSVGKRYAVMRTVDADGHEILRTSGILGNANRRHMVKPPPNEKAIWGCRFAKVFHIW